MTPVTIALGLDLGTTTTKAVLVDLARDGRTLRVERAATPDDAPTLLATVARLVRSCTTEAPVSAVGIASMAETGVAFDRSGAPLTPLLRWDRARPHGAVSWLRARYPALPERTGIPDTPKPALVTLLGLRETHPDVSSRIARWQGVADLVATALTGAHVTDHTLAARTMMLDPDADGRRWDAALLAELGLAEHVLPRILAAGEAAGTTRPGAFGLPTGIPVFVAGHDHAVGAWGAGVRHPGDVVDSLGTAEAVMTVTERVDSAAVRDGFSIGRTVDDRHATVMGGSPACGGLLAQWPGSPVDMLAAESGDAWRTSPVTVLPYPRGRQCPLPDPAARVRVHGTPVAEGDVERGLLQSLVFHARWMRSAMQQHSGIAANHVVLIGSLADRIPAWAPLVGASDVATGQGGTVRRRGTQEPVATAAALLAAVRAELAADTIVLDTTEVTPSVAEGLDKAYDRFLAEALAPRLPNPSKESNDNP